jgi:hypothetical protein
LGGVGQGYRGGDGVGRQGGGGGQLLGKGVTPGAKDFDGEKQTIVAHRRVAICAKEPHSPAWPKQPSRPQPTQTKSTATGMMAHIVP